MMTLRNFDLIRWGDESLGRFVNFILCARFGGVAGVAQAVNLHGDRKITLQDHMDRTSQMSIVYIIDSPRSYP